MVVIEHRGQPSRYSGARGGRRRRSGSRNLYERTITHQKKESGPAETAGRHAHPTSKVEAMRCLSNVLDLRSRCFVVAEIAFAREHGRQRASTWGGAPPMVGRSEPRGGLRGHTLCCAIPCLGLSGRTRPGLVQGRRCTRPGCRHGRRSLHAQRGLVGACSLILSRSAFPKQSSRGFRERMKYYECIYVRTIYTGSSVASSTRCDTTPRLSETLFQTRFHPLWRL